MPLTLMLRQPLAASIEAESLRPDLLAGLSDDEVARRPIWWGNREELAGEFFAIEGNLSDGHLIIEGDLRKVRRLGEGMASGRLTIRGDAGSHTGAGMTGGTISVEGSVGEWAGAEMRGGSLEIAGSAGDGLGAAYPGSRLGMRGGTIMARGDVGDDAGLQMRRGFIAVFGRSGEGLGRSLIAGTIAAFGTVGRRAGSGMKRGSLLLFRETPALLPTFAASGRYRPPYVTIYLKSLRERGVPIPDEAFAGEFERYNGDLVERGQGEILVHAC